MQKCPEFVSCFAKVCQLICLHFTMISSSNSRVVENGQMFLEYKQKQKLECSPFALSLKHHVITLQTQYT